MLGKKDKPAERQGFIKRLRARLNRGDSWLTYDLANLAPGGKIDEDALEDLESMLVEVCEDLALQMATDAEGASKVLDVFRSLNTVLELLEFDDDVENPTIQKLIKARDQARSEQNWELADRIRNQLRASGIIVQDDKL
mgnify:CR=1 FL=1